MNSRPKSAHESNGAVRQVLDYLAEDIAVHPERVKAVDAAFLERLRGLTEGVDVDVGDELSSDDE